jgi:hypothetical protein
VQEEEEKFILVTLYLLIDYGHMMLVNPSLLDGVESFQGDQLQFRPNPKILQRMQSLSLKKKNG